MAIQVTWLGHSAFLITINRHSIVIDPFLSGNPLAPVQADEIQVDTIVITHGHGDHIGDAVSIARRCGSTIIANNEVGTWLREQYGLDNVHTLNVGGGVQLPFGRVELTIALHSSSLPDGSYGGLACGVLIYTDEGPTLYHAGDTAVFLDMELIGEEGIDLAMLPIGDYFTMGIDSSLKAIDMLEPTAVIPMHYNTFGAIVQDAGAWAQRVNNETDAQPVVLDPGGTYTL